MKFLLPALLGVQLILCACQNNQKQSISDIKSESEIDQSPAQNAIAPGQSDFFSDSTIQEMDDDKHKQGQPQPKPQSQPTAIPDWNKKIIKNATLNFELKDYKTYSGALREKVRNIGGYIAQEEQTQSSYKIENTVTIKVPVDKFDEAIGLLTANVEKLNEKRVTSQDVTGEYVDTRSRMEAKKQVRERYMDLLKQARNMQEILNVQSEINEIQVEIESSTSRMQYLGQAAAFSTIEMTYFQVLDGSAKADATPTFGTRLSSAFKIGWSWIGELFVGLVSVWPLLLMIFCGFLIFKRNYKSRAKQA